MHRHLTAGASRLRYRGLYRILLIMMGAGWIANAQPADPEVRPWMPDVVSEFPNVRDMAISPDGEEYFFTVESIRKEFSTIVMMNRKNGTWSAPVVAPFSGQYRDIEPAFSPNGLELFFASTRPIDAASLSPGDYNIWYVTREEKSAAWSSPRSIGGTVNTEKDEFYPSLTMLGDLYFTRESDDPGRKEDIFVSRRTDVEYGPSHPLSDAVNSVNYEFNAFVAPDESYIVFTSYAREDDLGDGDLYISHRWNGEWTPARHLGEKINSKRIDYCPFVDTKNGVLYFTSERSSVRTSYDSPQRLHRLLENFRSGPVGAGRIYMIRFSPVPPGD